MTTAFTCLLAATATAFVPVPDTDFESAVLLLSGASVVEELGEEELEKFRRFVSSPLDINAASFSRLMSCGLLSEYQAASIVAARSRSGDILSWTELSLLDGFTPETAGALKCFAVLASSRPPGQREDLRPRHEIMARGMMKTAEGETLGAGGLKYGFKLGERAGLDWATRNTYSDPRIGVGTLSAAWYGRRHIGKIVAGDMALRFGQGLAVWTGFTLGGLSTIQSYRRNPTGISRTSSFTSEHKGVGVDFNFVSHSRLPAVYTVSAAYSIRGRLPVLNVSRTGRLATFGLTATSSALASDFKVGVASLGFFGEACWNFPDLLSPSSSASGQSVSAVAGVIWIPKYGTKVGGVARFVGNKLQTAAGYESTKFKLNFEGKLDYSKRTETYKLMLSTGDSLFNALSRNGIFRPSLRLTGKYRPQEGAPFRGDLRIDLDYAPGGAAEVWKVHWRTDLEYSRAFSWQTYIEGGYYGNILSVSGRAGVFHVDWWDDRIYVYERDLPGTFNCPALYGRGVNASALVKFSFPSRDTPFKRPVHTIYLKISYTGYLIDKPSRLEAKIQYAFGF